MPPNINHYQAEGPINRLLLRVRPAEGDTMRYCRNLSGPVLDIALSVLLLFSTANAEEPGSLNGGRLTTLPIERLVLPLGKSGQEMEVVVYAPHTYDPAQSYPLLVVLDADPLLGLLKTINFLWVEEGKVEPVILVGLPFGSSAGEIWTNRSYYLLPRSVGVIDYYDAQIPLNNGGGASELDGFLQEELLPRVLKQYSVDRERVGLVGFSMGGLFAAWHLATHPGVFRDYIIISPPLAPPFVGPEFENATQSLRRRGFDRLTRIYASYAEDDLAQVRSGAVLWIDAFDAANNANLMFRGEMIGGLRHDSGAIPALINGYEFLYAK